MRKLVDLSALLWMMSAAALPGQDEAGPVYAVIVNSKNTCTQTGDTVKATIKHLFLKQLSKWPDGTAARPYGRGDGDPEQIAFVSSVLDMGDAELARHWLRMKNSSGTTPPRSVSSERMTIKYVAKYEGALGIVRIDAVDGAGDEASDIKILYRF